MIDSTILVLLLRLEEGNEDTLSASSAYLLCNSPDAVIKCRQCRLCTFTHCNYYLFVGNVRDISCRINSRKCGAAKSVDLDFAYRSRLQRVTERSAIGCQTNLYEDTIQWEIPFFTTYTIFDADSCYLITVSHYLCGL